MNSRILSPDRALISILPGLTCQGLRARAYVLGLTCYASVAAHLGRRRARAARVWTPVRHEHHSGRDKVEAEEFCGWSAAHNVRFHRTGVKRYHHPAVGDLTLTYDALDLAADTELRISAYTAEPGSPSEDALRLLATWAATLDQAENALSGKQAGQMARTGRIGAFHGPA
jgi:hypothetical protein